MTKARPLITVVDEEPVSKTLMRLMRSASVNVETFGYGAGFLKSIDTCLPDCIALALPQRNWAAPHPGIRAARNGQSFTKYAQRALPRTLRLDDLTTIPPLKFSDSPKISANFAPQIRENLSEPRGPFLQQK